METLVGCGSEPPKTDYSDMYRMGEENPTDTEGKYFMSKWNDEAGDAEAGGLRVVKFPDSTGKIIRVSNENMPSDGNAAFGEINSILNQYFEGNPTCVLE